MSGWRPPELPQVYTRPPRGSVLVVSPHPDDEWVGPGGTLLHHAAQGDEIRILFICSGIQGDPENYYDRDEYVGLRERESREAARRFLGVENLHFLGYPDSLGDADLDHVFPGLPSDPDEKRRVLLTGLAGIIESEIAAFAPKTIYYPWTGEFHHDHWAAGRALETVFENRPELAKTTSALGYEVWATLVPDTVVDTTATHTKKLEAIGVFESQLRYHDYPSLVDGLNAHRAMLMNIRGEFYAEGFVGTYVSASEADSDDDGDATGATDAAEVVS